MSKFDVIIREGSIVDGTEKDIYVADIGIEKGKITYIGDLKTKKAEKEIIAKNLYVSPGFIDGHAHNDGYLFLESMPISKLTQGITTEISGNCGEGLVPINSKYFEEIKEYYKPYYITDDFKRMKDYESYFKAVDNLQLGINVGFYCAHGTIRMSTMGFEEREASKEEMSIMKNYLRDGMENGALGLSTGLIYSPGSFSNKKELVELCEVVKEFDGVYATHIRNEGDELVEAVQEAIDIARESEVKVIISHHKAIGKKNWNKIDQTLNMIKKANEEGLNVYFDQYPYTYNCTVLYWVIPIEYTEGGIGTMVERLKDQQVRNEIKKMFSEGKKGWDNPIESIGYSGITVMTAENTSNIVGKNIEEISLELKKDPADVIIDIIIQSNGNTLATYEAMSEDNICKTIKLKYGMIGTDGIQVKPNEMTHPRLFGTFPRILAKYVREKKIITIEEAVHKMTGMPASVLGLKNKGIIEKGYDADITIFDINKINDTATKKEPQNKAVGINYVLLAGEIVMQNGNILNKNIGRLIKKKEISICMIERKDGY